MLSLVVAATLVAAPLDVSSPHPSDPVDPTPWELFTALSGGLQPGTAAGTATSRIGVSRRVSRVFVPELHLLLGLAPNQSQLSTGLRLGTRIELPREGLRPFAYVSFAHIHEAGFEHFAHAPVAMLAGLSEEGVNHRSGGDVGLGVLYDFPKVRPGSLGGRAGLRTGMVGMLGSGPALTLEVVGTFGVVF